MKTKNISRDIKTQYKCRCCMNPSNSFLELESLAKGTGDPEKSYRDLLYEITIVKIPPDQENIMPQRICQKCGAQLKNAYKFIKRVSEISEQYLQVSPGINEEDVKVFEYLQESLMEVPEATMVEADQDEIKPDALSITIITKEAIQPEEFKLNEIKEEQKENGMKDCVNSNNYESQEERDFPENSNTDSSDDGNEDDEPRSEDDIVDNLSNEPIARSCDICHKVYRSEKFLNIHKRYTHMPEEDKLPCALCAYKASRSSALKVHMGLVHGPDKVDEYFKPNLDSSKKYPCSLCPRSYGRKDSLRKHIRRKHKNNSTKEEIRKKPKPPKQKEKERFLCTYCGQSYSSKCGLEGHVLTHTGERPYSCDICSKTFKRLKDLQLHRVIHSDEKPHQCSECGKAFKRIDKLKIHMRVHSELRPYKCNECEKTFKYPSVLRTHMHIHTGQTPFACKTCGEAFSLRTSLNNHCLKNNHTK